MNWGQNTTHLMPSSDDYDRSYGNGQPVKTVVYLNIAGDEQEVFNSVIPQNTTILDILLQIDRNSSHSGQAILASDDFSPYTGNYHLNNGYSFTDINNKCLNINLNTPVENIVTLGQQRQRQALFKIVYSIGFGCGIMGGQKSYKKYKKYKKTYNNKKRKSRKSRKSRRHRRK